MKTSNQIVRLYKHKPSSVNCTSTISLIRVFDDLELAKTAVDNVVWRKHHGRFVSNTLSEKDNDYFYYSILAS